MEGLTFVSLTQAKQAGLWHVGTPLRCGMITSVVPSGMRNFTTLPWVMRDDQGNQSPDEARSQCLA